MELRDVLRMLRSEIGLTQTELANAVNVCFSAENRWENKNTRPNRAASEAILALAKKHCVSSLCLDSLTTILRAPRVDDKVDKEKMKRVTEQMKLEQRELLTSEQLKTTIDNLDVAVIGQRVYSPESGKTDIFYYNKRYTEIFGYTDEAFAKRSSANPYFALPDASRSEYIRQLRQLLSGEISMAEFKPVIRAEKSGGQEMWLEVRCVSLNRYSYGYELFVSCRDVSQRVQTERRYQEEITLREASLHRFFSYIYCDITANTIYRHRNLSSIIGSEYAEETADEILSEISQKIPNETERSRFIDKFSCAALLKSFKEGDLCGNVRIFNMHARRWLQIEYILLSNPYNGHVEALLYISDIQEKALAEKLINSVSENFFEYMGLIDVQSKTLETYYYSDKCFKRSAAGVWDYPSICSRQLLEYGDTGYTEYERSGISFDTIIKALENSGNYTAVLRMRSYDGSVKVKRITYSYFDENRCTIFMAQSDRDKIAALIDDYAKRLS